MYLQWIISHPPPQTSPVSAEDIIISVIQARSLCSSLVPLYPSTKLCLVFLPCFSSSCPTYTGFKVTHLEYSFCFPAGLLTSHPVTPPPVHPTPKAPPVSILLVILYHFLTQKQKWLPIFKWIKTLPNLIPVFYNHAFMTFPLHILCDLIQDPVFSKHTLCFLTAVLLHPMSL